VGGSQIGIHYDSMLGKIIATGPTRAEATNVLRAALEHTWVPGLVTNRELLVRILAHPAFADGALHTHFLEQHAGELAAKPPGLERLRVAAIAATLAGIAARRAADGHALAAPGWRNVHFADQQVTYRHGEHDILVGYRPERGAGGGFTFAIGGMSTHVSTFELAGDRLTFVEHAGHRRNVRVVAREDRAYVLFEGALIALDIEPRFPDHAHQAVEGGLVAPMPGKVVKILASTGEAISAGAPLVVLEAMKMEHTVRAPEAGTLRELHVAVGDQVEADRLLAVVTP
jgi:propionyl-CoA carboxylase alpha chain